MLSAKSLPRIPEDSVAYADRAGAAGGASERGIDTSGLKVLDESV